MLDKFEVKENLHQGDFLNTCNLLCSPSFDQDKDIFLLHESIRELKSSRLVTPPCLGVGRGYHVSLLAMENIISTMMMINLYIDGNPTTLLIHLYNYRSIKAHHI
jgi:hypothetical protein